MNQAEADKYVWGFPAFANAFADLRHRVKIHPSIDWSAVLKIYERTKLCVNDPTAFGGPPIEAASFGIPQVGVECSLWHTTDPAAARWRQAPDYDGLSPAFPEFVGIGGVTFGGTGSPSVVDVLDNWHRDEVSYRKAGDAYRNYVDETYTYASFVRHLDALSVFK